MNAGIKKAGITLKYVIYNTKNLVVYLHGSHISFQSVPPLAIGISQLW